jgi:hypothetical protein
MNAAQELHKEFIARNRNKKRVNFYVYEAMLPAMRRLAKEKCGKESASLFAFMAVHKELKSEGIDFRKLLKKDS